MEKIKSTLILCYGYVAMYAPKELVLARIETDILKNIFQYFNTKVSCWAPRPPVGQPGCVGAGTPPRSFPVESPHSCVANVSCFFTRSGSGNKGRNQGTV